MGAKYTQLTDISGNLLYPITALDEIIPNKEEPDLLITNAGIIKRAYVPHDITQLLSLSTTAPQPTAAGDRYYNTTTKLIYTAYRRNDEIIWDTGSEPIDDCLFVDISNNRLFHWHDNDMHICGDGGHGGLVEGVDYVVLP